MKVSDLCKFLDLLESLHSYGAKKLQANDNWKFNSKLKFIKSFTLKIIAFVMATNLRLIQTMSS